MSKPTKKQIKVVADLMGRTLHNLDELGRHYAVVVEGIDQIFTNSTQHHAVALMLEQTDLQWKLREEILQAKAEKAANEAGWPRTDKD
jgi:hypothetical protein